MNPRIRHRTLVILFMGFCCFLASSAWGKPFVIKGEWYVADNTNWKYQNQSSLPVYVLSTVPKLSPTGGKYWYQGEFQIEEPEKYVLDFKNTSLIGYFKHYIFDENNQLVYESEGGVQDLSENPFFLRHGREMDLSQGRYRLITEVSSPFYLAHPQPYLNTSVNYRQSIRGGNALVLGGLGIFLGLGLYYAALSLSRRRIAEGMYTIFITSNFLYNGTALLVLPQLLEIQWFYLSSTPILFSNVAYIIFVMALLGVGRVSHPRLFKTGISLVGLLTSFIFFATLLPHWSMEFARYGVGIFLMYGLTAGIIRARQGHGTAKRYLVAIGSFFVLGGLAISQSQISGVYTYNIEHVGLFAVVVEVILLALVLSYQFGQLQRERESIFADYSNERIRREELAVAKEEADRANKAKSEFLSRMSHELRTPMNAILGFAQLMHYDEKLPKQYAHGVNETIKAGNHLLELINEVLDLAKVESGRIEMSIEKVELDKLIEESIRLVKNQADKRDIRISCVNLSGFAVQADRIRLKQVIINLLTNAIKYNRVSGNIQVDLVNQGKGKLRLKITDSGNGIAEEFFDRIFEPFGRLEAEHSDIEGTGIGLALSRTLVEQMCGTLGVESKVGRGSTFWVDLPSTSLPNLKEDFVEEFSHLSGLYDGLEGSYTVLYVEDNPANLDLMEQILAKHKNVSLITAQTPDWGLELADTEQPDLIILDINLPGLSGYEILDRLRMNPKFEATPVIALTANAMPSDIKRGLAAGFSEYLTKPLDVKRFLEILNRELSSLSDEKHQAG